MSYHRVSLSPSVASMRVTKKPGGSLSVTSIGCDGLIVGAWTDFLGTGTMVIETRHVLLFGGSPPSVALI